jgi:tetratricopeptide (TPR) repeat protein
MKIIIGFILTFVYLNVNSQTAEDLTFLQSSGKLNLIPMYGNTLIEKGYEYQKVDNDFIAFIDSKYNSRTKASKELVLLGYDFFYKGQLQTAMKRFNQAWLIDTINPGIYFGYWLIQEVLTQPKWKTNYFALNDKEIENILNADKFYSIGERLDSNNEYEKYVLDYACSSFSDYGLPNKGIESCKKRLEFDPKDTLALQNLSNTYSSIKDYNKAIEIQNSNIEFGKNKGYAYNDIAWYYQQLEKLDSAKLYFLKSINYSNKSYLKPRVNYAVLSEKTNDCEKGIKYINEAINQAPEEGFFYFIKGQLLICLNRKDEAKSTLKTGKKLGDKEAKELLKTL